MTAGRPLAYCYALMNQVSLVSQKTRLLSNIIILINYRFPVLLKYDIKNYLPLYSLFICQSKSVTYLYNPIAKWKLSNIQSGPLLKTISSSILFFHLHQTQKKSKNDCEWILYLPLIILNVWINSLTNCCPSVLDTVGWVTCNVLGGTLNPTLLLLLYCQGRNHLFAETDMSVCE